MRDVCQTAQTCLVNATGSFKYSVHVYIDLLYVYIGITFHILLSLSPTAIILVLFVILMSIPVAMLAVGELPNH